MYEACPFCRIRCLKQVKDAQTMAEEHASLLTKHLMKQLGSENRRVELYWKTLSRLYVCQSACEWLL